jgi:hypothetical protein
MNAVAHASANAIFIGVIWLVIVAVALTIYDHGKRGK